VTFGDLPAVGGLAWAGVLAIIAFLLTTGAIAIGLRSKRPSRWIRATPPFDPAPSDLVSLGIAGAAADAWVPFLRRTERRVNAEVVERTGMVWAQIPGYWARWRGRVPNRLWRWRQLRGRWRWLTWSAVWRSSPYAPRLDVWWSTTQSRRIYERRLARWIAELPAPMAKRRT
jgi:hypothetical protein